MAGTKKNSIGARVRQLREERGWSQTDLAGQLPGVKQQSVDQLEQGKVARPRFLPELAQVLSTSVQWLLTGEGPKSNRRATGDTTLDPDLLRDVVVAVENVLDQRRVKIDHKLRAEMIAVVYDMMLSEEKANPQRMEQAVSNIISYNNFLKRGG